MKAPEVMAKIKEEQEKCRQPMTGSARYIVSDRNNSRACTTGCQEFNTFFAYCNALKDELLNSSCGTERRQELYRKNCT